MDIYNPSNLILIEPLGYLEFTCLLVNSIYVITDSGGIQEETTALNVPCFTLRDNTERPLTLVHNGGSNKLVKKISDINLYDSGKITHVKIYKFSDKLWDGYSSKRIYRILKEIC
jgi:UDP-N-acetylglucosamine 2-epimerase (non-hydrolysing)